MLSDSTGKTALRIGHGETCCYVQHAILIRRKNMALTDEDLQQIVDAVNANKGDSVPNLPEFKQSKFYATWSNAFSALGLTGVIALPNTTFDEWLFWFQQWGNVFTKNYNDFKDAVNNTFTELDGDIKKINDDLESLHNRDTELEKELNDKYNNIVANAIVITPKPIASLAALVALLPNGSTDVYVAADNGHKYVWVNGSWTDAGVYQSMAIAENTVDVTEVNRVNYGNINISYLLLNKIRNYAQAQSVTQLSETSFIFRGVVNKGTGALVPFDFKKPIKKTGYAYLSFDYQASRDSDKMNGIYIADPLDNLKLKIGNLSTKATTQRAYLQVDLSTLTGITNKGSILFSSGDDYDFTVTNIKFNYNSFNLSSFDEEIRSANVEQIYNNRLDFSTYRSAFGQPGDMFKVDTDKLTFTRVMATGNGGFGFFVNVDTSKDVFITVEMGSVNNTGGFLITSSTSLGDFKIRFSESNLIDTETLKNGINRYLYRVTPAEFSTAAIKNTFGVLFVVAGADTMILKSLSVSNTIGFNENYRSQNEIFENIGLRKKSEIGDSPININQSAEKAVNGGMLATYTSSSSVVNGILERFKIYAKSAGTLTITVGQLDQNMLLVSNTTFTLSVNVGYNDIDLTSRKISMEPSFKIFVNINDVGVYTPDTVNTHQQKTLIQDSDHYLDGSVYKGYYFYEENVVVPFSYTVIEKNVNAKISDVNEVINTTNKRIDDLAGSGSNINLTAPDGTKYGITIDNDGNLVAVNISPKKLRVIGNSLTHTTGDIGMASSDQYHDYWYLLTSYLKNKYPTLDIGNRGTGGNWETATPGQGRIDAWNQYVSPQIDSDSDIVILQLIDNVHDSGTSQFKTDAVTLLNNIHTKAPKAKVYWVARWYSSDDFLNALKEACLQANATQIDITDIARMSDTKSYIGAVRTGIDGTSWTVTSAGEASHPGDKGHSLIADRIISTLGL